MDGFLIAAVLFAALLHAGWNALVKIGGDGLVTIFLFKTLSAPVGAILLIFTGLPDTASMPYAFASGVILLFYCMFLGHAYQNADFSMVYPVARGVAPPAVAVLAMVLVGETLESSVFIGTAIVSIGILLLTYARQIDRSVMAGLASAVGVGVTIAAYTLVDGIGARYSGDPIAYIAFLNLATYLPLGAYVMARRRAVAVNLVRREWRRGLIGGCIMFMAYGIVIFAMTRAPMGMVSALRETSVIIAAVIGTWMMKEPFGPRRFAAACVVTIGVGIIIMSRG
ncbi:MAG: EamA family transporter [Rhodospirillaceae bacterium]|nr:EamA family transporter [Rhodospirillaceae bacterium]MBT5513691.1 EamA family transporter [Rhodospirillaceae bacterium]MBT6608077.1 EamA family transporter [Rhodospirillaceae bacterium]MBT7248308.1 EamA family transporter [Rhodospirillaceae bacterium]MBT7509215.1 EamA family transporter [Rhodospirillaceae bacterium]